MQYFSLAPGQSDRRLKHLAILDESFCERLQSTEEAFTGLDREPEILRPRTSQHALCGQQTGDVIDRQAPVGIRLHFKALRTGSLIKENISFWMNCELWLGVMDYCKILSSVHDAP